VTKVLYVEDNDDDVYMLKMRLELLGIVNTQIGAIVLNRSGRLVDLGNGVGNLRGAARRSP
jgi:hypothetical protein